MTAHTRSKQGFQSLLQIAASSLADPPCFATPIHAEEDEYAILILFHVSQKEHEQVRVDAYDQTLKIWDPDAAHRAKRVCHLPSAIVSPLVDSSRSGDILRVRLPKKRPALATFKPPELREDLQLAAQ